MQWHDLARQQHHENERWLKTFESASAQENASTVVYFNSLYEHVSRLVSVRFHVRGSAVF